MINHNENNENHMNVQENISGADIRLSSILLLDLGRLSRP